MTPHEKAYKHALAVCEWAGLETAIQQYLEVLLADPATVEAVARAIFNACPASGWTTWEKLNEDQRRSYRDDATAALSELKRLAEGKA